jgi:hypothetical protein
MLSTVADIPISSGAFSLYRSGCGFRARTLPAADTCEVNAFAGEDAVNMDDIAAAKREKCAGTLSPTRVAYRRAVANSHRSAPFLSKCAAGRIRDKTL